MTYQCEVPREGRICCNDPGAGEGEVVRVSDTLAGWQPSGVYFHEREGTVPPWRAVSGCVAQARLLPDPACHQI